VWELEVPVRQHAFHTEADLEVLRTDFHGVHRDSFAVADEGSSVEIITWGARARGRISHESTPHWGRGTPAAAGETPAPARRRVFVGGGWLSAAIYQREGLPRAVRLGGPAIIESASTTVVVPDGATVVRGPLGSLLMRP